MTSHASATLCSWRVFTPCNWTSPDGSAPKRASHFFQLAITPGSAIFAFLAGGAMASRSDANERQLSRGEHPLRRSRWPFPPRCIRVYRSLRHSRALTSAASSAAIKQGTAIALPTICPRAARESLPHGTSAALKPCSACISEVERNRRPWPTLASASSTFPRLQPIITSRFAS